MIIHKCDKCGKLAEQKAGQSSNVPTGWVPLTVNADAYSSAHLYYEICRECADALKIPQEYRDRVPDIGARLIEILSEVVAEQIPQQS